VSKEPLSVTNDDCGVSSTTITRTVRTYSRSLKASSRGRKASSRSSSKNMHSQILASCCERDFNRGIALFIALFNRKVVLHLSWAFRRKSHSRAFLLVQPFHCFVSRFLFCSTAGPPKQFRNVDIVLLFGPAQHALLRRRVSFVFYRAFYEPESNCM
jgi:hypothetical protein